MKKLALALIGLTLVGSSAFAQTTGVLSRNAVGYVRVTTTKSNFVMVANNFISLDGAPLTVTNIIGSQLPNGSAVLLWNEQSQSYVVENRSAGNWNPGTNRLTPGRGFWIKMPTTASHSNNYQVYIMGEVPDKTTLPSNSVTVLPGLNFVANPYPTSTLFTNLPIAVGGRNGDAALFWNEGNQSYGAANRSAGNWNPSTNILYPGQSFWYRSSRSTNVTWVQAKPYTWP